MGCSWECQLVHQLLISECRLLKSQKEEQPYYYKGTFYGYLV